MIEAVEFRYALSCPMAIRTFYEILGIAHDADDEEIRRAYRRVMQEHHPDQNPDDRKAARRTRHLNAAKAALLDKDKRRRYDRKLRRKGILPEQPAANLNEPSDRPDEAAATESSPIEKAPGTSTTAGSEDTDRARTRSDRWKANKSGPSQWIPKPHFTPPPPALRRIFVTGGGILLVVAVLWSLYLIVSNAQLGIFPTSHQPIERTPLAASDGNAKSQVDGARYGRMIPKQLTVTGKDKPTETQPADKDQPNIGDTSNQPSNKPSTPPSGSSSEPGEVGKFDSSQPRLPLATAPYDVPQAERYQQQWARLIDQPVEQTNSIGMTFELIPPGQLLVGFPEQAKIQQGKRSTPSLQAIDRPFYISRQPVSQAQWKQVMGTEPWVDREPFSSTAGDNTFATWMDWQAANEFCIKLSDIEGKQYRMPYQLEWEYAWRAGKSNSFYLSDVAWQTDEKLAPPHQNRFGIRFAPLLWEFCQDVNDDQTHVARRPAVLHSANLGRQLALGTASPGRSQGFRLALIPDRVDGNHLATPTAWDTIPVAPLMDRQASPDPAGLPVSWTSLAQVPKRQLIPGPRARADATAAIKNDFETFSLESSSGKARAVKMFRHAAEVLESAYDEQDAAQLFAKLDRATRYFAASGDPKGTDHCIDLLVENFQVDYLSLHIDAARRWSKLIFQEWVLDKAAKSKSLAIRVKRLASQAEAAHRYEDQIGLLELYLDLLSPKHKDIVTIENNLTVVRKRAERHREMMHLKEQLIFESEPRQETELGEYLCFVLNDWDRAVPHLAKGLAGPLQRVAQFELEKHDSLDGRLMIAEGWWNLANQRSDAVGKAMKDRSCQWYQAAYPDLTGAEKDQTNQRLRETYARSVDWTFRFQPGFLPDKLIQRGRTAQRKTGLLLYPESAIALDTVFSSIESVTIRGRIQSPFTNNFRFQAGPIHAIFNWQIKPVNHFRTFGAKNRRLGGKVSPLVDASLQLQPGKFHTFKITKSNQGELLLSVDGKRVYRTKGEFRGGVMIFSADDPIEIESLQIRGTPDPLSVPAFVDRFDLQLSEPRQR